MQSLTSCHRGGDDIMGAVLFSEPRCPYFWEFRRSCMKGLHCVFVSSNVNFEILIWLCQFVDAFKHRNAFCTRFNGAIYSVLLYWWFHHLILKTSESHRSHFGHFLLPHICNGISSDPKLDWLSDREMKDIFRFWTCLNSVFFFPCSKMQ